MTAAARPASRAASIRAPCQYGEHKVREQAAGSPEARQCARTGGSWSAQLQESHGTCPGYCACQSSQGARLKPLCPPLKPPLGSGGALCTSITCHILHCTLLGSLLLGKCCKTLNPAMCVVPLPEPSAPACCVQTRLEDLLLPEAGMQSGMHSSNVNVYLADILSTAMGPNAQYLCRVHPLQGRSAVTVCRHYAYVGLRIMACGGYSSALLSAWLLLCCCVQGLVLLSAQPWYYSRLSA